MTCEERLYAALSGKVFEIEVNGISREEAGKVIPEIAHKVLANPIIEKFDWQIIR